MTLDDDGGGDVDDDDDDDDDDDICFCFFAAAVFVALAQDLGRCFVSPVLVAFWLKQCTLAQEAA